MHLNPYESPEPTPPPPAAAPPMPAKPQGFGMVIVSMMIFAVICGLWWEHGLYPNGLSVWHNRYIGGIVGAIAGLIMSSIFRWADFYAYRLALQKRAADN